MVVVVVVSIATTIATALIYWRGGTYPGFGYWLLGNLSRLLAVLILLLPRDQYPPWLTIVIANYLLFAEQLLYLRGTLLFRGRPAWRHFEIVVSTIFILLFIWYTYVDDNLQIRLIVSALFPALVGALLLRTILHQRPPYFGSIDRLVVLAWSVVVTTYLARALYRSLFESPTTPLPESGSFPLWLLLLIFNMILITLGHIMLHMQRLEYDLGESQRNLDRDIATRIATERQLRLSEQRHRLLAEQAQDLIWTMDLKGRLTDISDAVVRLCGHQPSRLLQQPLTTIHPPDSVARIEAYLQQLRQALQQQQPLPRLHDELIYRCRNGTTIAADVYAFPQQHANGAFWQLVGVSRNITERKRHQQQLRHEQQAAEQAQQALRRIHTKLQQLANTDQLTGASNRIHLEEALRQLRQRSHNAPAPALLLFDIDHFKQINDRFGHLAGDQVLIELVQRCRQLLPPPTLLARWGGEEFVILLTETLAEQASALAERLRQQIAATPFSGVGVVTISLGGTRRHFGELDDHWLQRTDEALYSAKSQGRNRVVWIA